MGDHGLIITRVEKAIQDRATSECNVGWLLASCRIAELQVGHSNDPTESFSHCKLRTRRSKTLKVVQSKLKFQIDRNPDR